MQRWRSRPSITHINHIGKPDERPERGMKHGVLRHDSCTLGDRSYWRLIIHFKAVSHARVNIKWQQLKRLHSQPVPALQASQKVSKTTYHIQMLGPQSPQPRATAVPPAIATKNRKNSQRANSKSHDACLFPFAPLRVSRIPNRIP